MTLYSTSPEVENNTFTLTNLPEGKKAVGGRWVYAIKNNPDGSEKYKARYVVRGYSQKMGEDYEETFSPTASLTCIRVLMRKAAQEDLILHQMDGKTAYLIAPIDCEIYVEQPEGYEVKSHTNEKLVCTLQRSLYGLKHSGRNWNKVLHDDRTQNNLAQNQADHCIYTRETEHDKVIMAIWIDDLIIAGSDDNALKVVKDMHTKYVGKILERFNMQNCKPRSTPCEQKLNYTDEAALMNDVTSYREAGGSLIYLTVCTRPDLSFVVSKLSQYFTEPTEQQ